MESDEEWSSTSSSLTSEENGDSLPARIGCLVLSVGYAGLAIFPFVNVVRMAILASRKRREERATLMPREYANESHSPVCSQLFLPHLKTDHSYRYIRCTDSKGLGSLVPHFSVFRGSNTHGILHSRGNRAMEASGKG